METILILATIKGVCWIKEGKSESDGYRKDKNSVKEMVGGWRVDDGVLGDD